jgi:hypothetical protein
VGWRISPSVEVPIGDFYGLGLGEYFTYQSALLAVAPIKALNAYFQMPFSSAARLTLTNEGKVRTDNLYFAVDYVTVPRFPAMSGASMRSIARPLHAKAGPTTGRTTGTTRWATRRTSTARAITSSWKPRAGAILWA